jgi:hypothetical protein
VGVRISSHAPEAHTLKCSRGAQALLVRCKRITLFKPGFYLGLFNSTIGKQLHLSLQRGTKLDKPFAAANGFFFVYQ